MSDEPLHYALDLPTFQTLLMLRKVYLWLQWMTNHFPSSKYFLVAVPSLDLLSFHHQCPLPSFRHLLLVWCWHLFCHPLDKSLLRSLEASQCPPSFSTFLGQTALHAGELVLPYSLFSSSPPSGDLHQHTVAFPFFHHIVWVWGWDQQLAKPSSEHAQLKCWCFHTHTTRDALSGPPMSSWQQST